MSAKEQAYQAHAFVRSGGVSSTRRSHIHELLAALLGYRTFAAFQHDAVWCDVPMSLVGQQLDVERLRERCMQIGLPDEEVPLVVRSLSGFLQDSGYASVRFEELIAAASFDETHQNWKEWVWNQIVRPSDGLGPVLCTELEAAADRGVINAHYAIAKLLEGDAEYYGDEADRLRRSIKRQGTWTAPFVSFNEVNINGLLLEEKYRHHLFEAARAGHVLAAMDSARFYADPALLNASPTDDVDPLIAADLAAEYGDHEKLKYWLTVAAEQGDVGAMRELIMSRAESNEQAWVWIYLSKLLGGDLEQDHFVAINDDGTLWDDDVGGPAQLGGHQGIQLPKLNAEVDHQARLKAEELLRRIDDLSQGM